MCARHDCFVDHMHVFLLHYLDLESFWSEEGLAGLPRGVLESLRKVTSPNGLLSFERFCAGLKICLLRYQVFNDLLFNACFKILLVKNFMLHFSLVGSAKVATSLTFSSNIGFRKQFNSSSYTSSNSSTKSYCYC
jgi:hypothetical protein